MTRTQRLAMGLAIGVTYLLIGYIIVSDLTSASIVKYVREVGYSPDALGYGFIVASIGYLYAGIKCYAYNFILVIPFALYNLMTGAVVLAQHIAPTSFVIYSLVTFMLLFMSFVDWRYGVQRCD